MVFCNYSLPLLLAGTIGGALSALEVESAKLFTNDAFPVAPGEFEASLETLTGRAGRSFDASQHVVDRGGALRTKAVNCAFTYGLGQNLDVGIATSHVWIDDAAAANNGEASFGRGCTSVDLSAKYQFFATETEPVHYACAVVPFLGVPLNDPQTQDTDGQIATAEVTWRPGLDFVLSLAADRFSLAGVVGGECPCGEHRETQRMTWHSDLALGCQCAPWCQFIVEGHYRHDLDQHRDNDCRCLSVSLGVLVPLEHLRLGFGFDRPIAGKNSDQENTFLCQITIPF
jgi:hypothetical protein